MKYCKMWFSTSEPENYFSYIYCTVYCINSVFIANKTIQFFNRVSIETHTTHLTFKQVSCKQMSFRTSLYVNAGCFRHTITRQYFPRIRDFDSW